MARPYVLVAEDDKFIRKLFTLNLVSEDWEVQTATNGQETIDSIEQRRPDLLLLDLLMPVVDGYGVLEYLHQQPYKLPVIILSNLSQEIDERRARELGAVDFFLKSNLDIDELQLNMKEVLSAQDSSESWGQS